MLTRWRQWSAGVLAVVLASTTQVPGIEARSTDPIGTGVTVAIIDTGFDTAHEFFRRPDDSSAFIAEVCLEVCGAPVMTGPGRASAPSSRRLSRRHGTHIAGVIAGSWQRAPSRKFADLSGLAPGVSLVGVRIFGDDDATIDPKRITRALDWLADHRDDFELDVVNLSLGGGSSAQWCSRDHPDMQRAVTRLWDAGVIVVAGSGNAGERQAMTTPACLRHVVSVAALDDTGRLASWSNRSRVTTVAAPGMGIWSSVPGFDARGRRAAISIDSGTSVAAAVVTGTIATLVDVWPDATPEQIVRALRSGPRRTGGVSVLDPIAALRHLTAASEPSPAKS